MYPLQGCSERLPPMVFSPRESGVSAAFVGACELPKLSCLPRIDVLLELSGQRIACRGEALSIDLLSQGELSQRQMDSTAPPRNPQSRPHSASPP